MPGLKWTDSDEIGYQLSEKFPEQDPLRLRFTALRQRVLELPDFADDPSGCDEAILEAIQMAWVQYHSE
jgi:FeS assembly protein IscX